MRLLVITQKVDKNDSILGFFHKWLIKLAPNFDGLSVVCLEKGEFDLPDNIKVFSLGKEKGSESRIKNSELWKKIKYTLNFWKLVWSLRDQYDSVFVHMNQEYVVLAGPVWLFLGKKVFFWRNHPQGNLFTYLAVWFSDRVFCTSEYSFTAQFPKTEIMGVGIDTDLFRQNDKAIDLKSKISKILFLSRMSPIKKPDLLLEALYILDQAGVDFKADFYGDPTPKDFEYYDFLLKKVNDLGLVQKVKFHNAVPNDEVSNIYHKYGLFINLTPSGSFDKTIVEAMLCGCVPIVINKSLAKLTVPILAEESSALLAEKIKFWLDCDQNFISESVSGLQKYALEKHSLNALIEALCIRIKGLV